MGMYLLLYDYNTTLHLLSLLPLSLYLFISQSLCLCPCRCLCLCPCRCLCPCLCLCLSACLSLSQVNFLVLHYQCLLSIMHTYTHVLRFRVVTLKRRFVNLTNQ